MKQGKLEALHHSVFAVHIKGFRILWKQIDRPILPNCNSFP